MKRSKIGYKKSKKIFKKTASWSHKLNNIHPMRGGIRL